jgi:hypothetical protein
MTLNKDASFLVEQRPPIRALCLSAGALLHGKIISLLSRYVLCPCNVPLCCFFCDAHIHEHTLTHMNARTRYLYEHLRKTKLD